MKSRGYGLPQRTAFSNYNISKRDVKALVYIFVLAIFILCSAVSGNLYFSFYPSLKGSGYDYITILTMAAYFMISFMPIIIEGWEAYKWKALKSKI